MTVTMTVTTTRLNLSHTMPTEHTLDASIARTIERLVNNPKFHEFQPIRENETVIDSCLKIVTNDEGEDVACKGDAVSLKKIGPVEKLFHDADYVIVVHNTAWKEANDTVQEALIHRALMRIKIDEKDKEDGEKDAKGQTVRVKYGTKKPDIVEHSETLTRYGLYTQPLSAVADVLGLAAKNAAKAMAREV